MFFCQRLPAKKHKIVALAQVFGQIAWMLNDPKSRITVCIALTAVNLLTLVFWLGTSRSPPPVKNQIAERTSDDSLIPGGFPNTKALFKEPFRNYWALKDSEKMVLAACVVINANDARWRNLMAATAISGAADKLSRDPTYEHLDRPIEEVLPYILQRTMDAFKKLDNLDNLDRR